MDYKLAKQLKDAGFPFKKSCCNKNLCACSNQGMKELTLEELIEACGDGFDTLHKNRLDNVWHAGIGDGADGGDLVGIYPTRGEGKTKKEAVAKLYIKLNEKNNDKK